MKKYFVLISLMVLVIMLWLLTLWGGMTFSASWEHRGQFGDLFGSVNALFSGFAFAGIIYTIFLQRKELSLQRKELRLQREEMEASRKELAAQVKVQEAIHLANIKQISVTAGLAQIESLKIEAIDASKEERIKIAEGITNISKRMEEISYELNSNFTNNKDLA